ncbi:RNA polymerase sigma factor [Allostreptomyces psammosilenae]|uniref:RNA polymerase sigma factor (Sigma-70 family) n=1 Tax=Allostreptomyces psammosilenae TaxID=1892865 RepID=A0A853A291_9ACTN|nr:sigma-70 family RNA polymerase sigma factor [Allostreptomyces psammosilenae]NYI07580.1 RNA polymerase sigma factor (sigma-70 family) [Allostreptomyces psammosilenae]
MDPQPVAEDLLRRHAPQVLGALVRRYGHFDAAEDAVQEALLAAAVQWPTDGLPQNPRGWLIRVASRRLIDQLRAEEARRRREETAAALTPRDELLAPAPDEPTTPEPATAGPSVPAAGASRAPSEDDTLTLLFLCCHPALAPASQVALTLRAVGGLTTAEIARAYLVPEATLAQRISRAKKRIKDSGVPFRQPTGPERAGRLAAVLQVLYLVFNEGYTASSGDRLQRADLAAEAIRLTRAVHRLLPDDGEVAGLLALMLLTDARRPARTAPDGALVPLAEQDRSRWNGDAIAEGVALVTDALARHPLGPYQLQAAIAAVHDEAPSAESTDWPQILALYDVLARVAPGPMVTLNRAVALAMVHGPRAGLAVLEPLSGDARMADHHRLHAVRAHLLQLAGEREAAREAYRRAADGTLSLPEERYLRARAAALAPNRPGG